MTYIQSVKNQQVKEWRKLLTKKGRDRTGTYIIEGFHLVEEALQSRQEIVSLMIDENVDIPLHWDLQAFPTTTITAEVSAHLSSTETSQGVFAICRIPKFNVSTLKGSTFLLLDAIQDPGNLGTMIRTADAAGIDAVILGEGTVDVYNSKVIRAAQGSHFHLPILTGQLPEWIQKLQNQQIPVYGTALEGGVSYKTVQSSTSFALLVGNEGNGVAKTHLSLTTSNLYIPLYGKSESLNVAVATGILLYHLKDAN
ncbi:TrmH family RNA methyltransferase [Bacillus chungangensis]|uniref:TrmH family RNA methyltransferase n=1 Tax=Bacillus chungangensis TaxID=587633 RepID=A0ABT9WMI5_9BACI|nr:RNA methyltransferase [Bacillus chungangensis]MDQ0174508.1 TrmH family RNA methyltransferase [Bacillus chungangensis]